MKLKGITAFAASLAALTLLGSTAWAQEMTFDPNDPAVIKGHEIMKGIDSLPVHQKLLGQAELLIYDKQDNLLFTKRFRYAQYFEDYNKPEVRLRRSINYFFAPADDKGNGSMVFENEDSDDDEQYLYLRQIRKARRIIGSSKKDDFFGSDFSLGDVTRRRYQDYNFRWLGEDAIDFRGKRLKMQKIESQFKDPQNREDWGEGKSVLWVHPSSGLVFKAERYNTQMQLHKVLTLIAFGKHKNPDGKNVYSVGGLRMETINRGTRSQFLVKSTKYEGDSGISPSIYTTDSFTKKWW